MKSIKYIIVVGLLGLFSCQKEDIKPNRASDCNNGGFDNISRNAMSIQSDSSKDVFVKDFTYTGTDKDDTEGGSSSSDGGTISTGEIITDTGGGITDPNNEPDASKRKGKK